MTLLKILALLVVISLYGTSIYLWMAPPSVSYPILVKDFQSKMDFNGDGGVDEAEFQRVAPGTFAFETIDLNKNGLVDDFEVERLIVNISPQMPSKNRLPRVQ